LITAALVAGMVGCIEPDPPCRDLEIRDWYDLDDVRHNLSGHHRLMNDLDATTAGYVELAGPAANDGKGWEPIGAYVSSDRHNYKAFTGVLDGQGYEIGDLFVNRPHLFYAGLFGYVYDGTIGNVGVVNAVVTGNMYVGGLVGTNADGTVRNSYFSGDVIGRQHSVGGLVGWNSGTVTKCYAAGSVTGNQDVGGLTGSCSGWVGNSYSDGAITGHWKVGGLVGANGGAVSNSYAAGNVTGWREVGGLVGANQVDFVDVSHGFVRNCYSTDSVAGDFGVGGLVGDSYEPNVSNSLWDVETSGMEESEGGTGKTTAEMQDIGTFTDTETEGLDEPWDICAVLPGQTDEDCIWNIVDGQTYPFLSWQPVS
jgi:hypothetical protein